MARRRVPIQCVCRGVAMPRAGARNLFAPERGQTFVVAMRSAALALKAMSSRLAIGARPFAMAR